MSTTKEFFKYECSDKNLQDDDDDDEEEYRPVQRRRISAPYDNPDANARLFKVERALVTLKELVHVLQQEVKLAERYFFLCSLQLELGKMQAHTVQRAHEEYLQKKRALEKDSKDLATLVQYFEKAKAAQTAVKQNFDTATTTKGDAFETVLVQCVPCMWKSKQNM